MHKAKKEKEGNNQSRWDVSFEEIRTLTQINLKTTLHWHMEVEWLNKTVH